MPTAETVKSLNAIANYIHKKIQEYHNVGMCNLKIAEQAYLSPWWNTGAPCSDANDGDGSVASPLDRNCRIE